VENMASDYKKSAKDLAFDKERAKYNKQIRELESQLKEKDKIIYSLKDDLEEHKDKIIQLEDWINRLLEYTELSEEDMKNIINKEKTTADILNRFNSMTSIFKSYGLGWQ
jgi:predicted RNase H-like nuclease (RuvC/YqgF family)